MKYLHEIKNCLENSGVLEADFGLSENSDVQINDITYDSREVKKSSLFICKGKEFKEEYLKSAAEKGASAYISVKRYDSPLPALIVNDIREAMSLVSAFFFDYPDRELEIFGITGTKGKTTTTHALASILTKYSESLSKKPCGIISSMTIYDGITNSEAHHTTPEPIDLYRALRNCVTSGLHFVALEISSQGLKYKRVNHIKLKAAAFLNIDIDHISEIEHKDYEDYLSSKLKILNLTDTLYYSKDMKELKRLEREASEKDLKMISFSAKGKPADYTAEDIGFEGSGVKFSVSGNDYKVNLPGLYNVENCLCAIAMASEYGISPEFIKEGIASLELKGRSSLFITCDRKIAVLVSYAHNALSLKNVFENLDLRYPGVPVVSLFGAPGGKAFNRRKDLSEIAGASSEAVYIVPINPGYEEYRNIAEEMISYVKAFPCRYNIFETREEGLREAFKEAETAVSAKDLRSLKNAPLKSHNQQDHKTNLPDVIICISGKGNEKFQYVRGNNIPIHSDYEVAKLLTEDYNRRHKNGDL